MIGESVILHLPKAQKSTSQKFNFPNQEKNQAATTFTLRSPILYLVKSYFRKTAFDYAEKITHILLSIYCHFRLPQARCTAG
jgi:hypothetical protein